jgi:hypothetical protein
MGLLFVGVAAAFLQLISAEQLSQRRIAFVPKTEPFGLYPFYSFGPLRLHRISCERVPNLRQAKPENIGGILM